MIEQRAKLYKEAAELNDSIEAEGRAYTEEENQKWDKLNDEINAVEERINKVETLNALSAKQVDELAQEAERKKQDVEQIVDARELEKQAITQYLRGGERSLTNEQHELLRAQTVGTNTEGGFTVPQAFSNEIDAAMLEFGGMREAARIITTDSGNQIDWPVYDDTGNSGALISESTANSQVDVVFANKNLDAYKYTSREIFVSSELLNDSFFSVENDIIRPAFGERLGRATNAHMTTGTGSSQPNGVVTASTLGTTAASATAITFDELFDLMHSVDPAYRRRGAKWMLEDLTLKSIRKLKDGESRYIWQGSVDSAQPNTILGHEYIVNQDMATIAASAKSVLFGDFSKYVIRDVAGSARVLRSEHYRINTDETAFVAFVRTDGDLMSNGAPIKHLIQASS